MARCKKCPAIEEFNLYGIEDIEFTNGCPDIEYDCYGGDCYNSHNFDDCPECGGRDCLEYTSLDIKPKDYYDDPTMVWCKRCQKSVGGW